LWLLEVAQGEDTTAVVVAVLGVSLLQKILLHYL